MAIKLNSMTEREIESIAEAFAKYQYEDGKEGLFLFGTRMAKRCFRFRFRKIIENGRLK